MGWNNKTPEDKPACSTPSLDIKTDACLPLSEICSDGLDTDKQYALSNQGGTTVAVEIVPTDLTEVNDAIAANAAAIAALVDKTLNTVYTGTTNDNPADGIVTLNFDIIDQDGNVESTYTIDVPDSTELPDVNTTYVLNPTPNGGFSAQPVDEGGNPIGVPFLLGSDDQTANEVSISDAGDYYVSSDVEGALQEIGADCADKEARIAALEAVNPVVDTEVIAGTSDVVVTYLDGTTETLDLPEFTAATDADGNVTFDLNGTPFGPFDVAPDDDTFVSVVTNPDGSVIITDTAGVDHVVSGDLVDDDTFATAVDNGDGTITFTLADGSTQTVAATDTDTAAVAVDNGDGTTTVTYADGSTYTYTQGLVVDTDTVVTYNFTWAADGSVTITGSDGSTFTGPPNTVDTDTNTFATLSGQTITFANGDTLTVPAPYTDDDAVQDIGAVASETAAEVGLAADKNIGCYTISDCEFMVYRTDAGFKHVRVNDTLRSLDFQAQTQTTGNSTVAGGQIVGGGVYQDITARDVFTVDNPNCFPIVVNVTSELDSNLNRSRGGDMYQIRGRTIVSGGVGAVSLLPFRRYRGDSAANTEETYIGLNQTATGYVVPGGATLTITQWVEANTLDSATLGTSIGSTNISTIISTSGAA